MILSDASSAMLFMDEAHYLLSRSIPLSRLPTRAWAKSMDKKMRTFKTCDICELAPHVPGMCTLRIGWVLTGNLRMASSGMIRLDSSLVATTGSPVLTTMSHFRLLLCPEFPRKCDHTVAAISDLDVIESDIIPGRLQSTFKEDISMEKQDCYADPRRNSLVWHLKKGLCGLVQTGRTWNEELGSHVESGGFPASYKRTPQSMSRTPGTRSSLLGDREWTVLLGQVLRRNSTYFRKVST